MNFKVHQNHHLMKIFLTLILLTVPLLGFSKTVDEATRLKVASNFFGSFVKKVPEMRLVCSGEGRKTKSGEESVPAYYIYNNAGGGFAIIAGDDCVGPVIGYSDSGAIEMDNIPVNMKEWLDMWEEVIEKMKKQGVSEPRARLQWQSLSSGIPATRSGFGAMLLETANWDQAYPYNLQCPKDGNQISLTGCTATATCIVMRYHKWPDAGVGTAPAYTTATKKIKVPEITLGTKYRWDKMPLNYTSSWTTEQKNAVAQLMAEVGALIRSDYAAESTGSHLYYVAQVLNPNLKFDKSFLYCESGFYTSSQWVDMLKDNIAETGPVLYAGYSPEGGHAFVVDGYDEEDRLHINWGWGGYGNGYYTYPYFNDFTSSHMAILNIRKDAGGSYADDIRLYCPEEPSPFFSVSTSSFTTGTTFSSTFIVANYGYETFDGEVGVAKFDRNGNIVEICGKSTFKLISGHYREYELSDCVMKSSIKIGEYLSPVYKSESTPDWTRFPYDRNNPQGYTDVIHISDMYSLGEKTSLAYDPESRICTIVTKDEVSFTLNDSKGVDVSDACSMDSNILTINALNLKGEYGLILQNGIERKEMILKF